MTSPSQVTTILGCKNFMLREGLKHILSSTRFKVCPEDLRQKGATPPYLQSETPLLIMLDANLYPNSVSETIRQLKEDHPDARIVILADEFDLNGMISSLQAGANGYCLTTSGCETLIKYLELVMLGEVVFPSSTFFSVFAPSAEAVHAGEAPIAAPQPQTAPRTAEVRDSPIRHLSSREAEILHCLMQGAPNKVIARKLEVAEATVKVHIKAILRKIRVANRTQAAMWAVNHLSAGNAEHPWVHSAEAPAMQSPHH